MNQYDPFHLQGDSVSGLQNNGNDALEQRKENLEKILKQSASLSKQLKGTFSQDFTRKVQELLHAFSGQGQALDTLTQQSLGVLQEVERMAPGLVDGPVDAPMTSHAYAPGKNIGSASMQGLATTASAYPVSDMTYEERINFEFQDSVDALESYGFSQSESEQALRLYPNVFNAYLYLFYLGSSSGAPDADFDASKLGAVEGMSVQDLMALSVEILEQKADSVWQEAYDAAQSDEFDPTNPEELAVALADLMNQGRFQEAFELFDSFLQDQAESGVLDDIDEVKGQSPFSLTLTNLYRLAKTLKMGDASLSLDKRSVGPLDFSTKNKEKQMEAIRAIISDGINGPKEFEDLMKLLKEVGHAMPLNFMKEVHKKIAEFIDQLKVQISDPTQLKMILEGIQELMNSPMIQMGEGHTELTEELSELDMKLSGMMSDSKAAEMHPFMAASPVFQMNIDVLDPSLAAQGIENSSQVIASADPRVNLDASSARNPDAMNASAASLASSSLAAAAEVSEPEEQDTTVRVTAIEDYDEKVDVTTSMLRDLNRLVDDELQRHKASMIGVLEGFYKHQLGKAFDTMYDTQFE